MRRWLVLVSLALALCPADAQAAQPTEPPLAYQLSDGGFALSRLDPLTLAPLEPHGDVGEWHFAYSLAPGGGQLASSISHPGLPDTPGGGRVGLRVYDLTTFDIVREFRLGSAAGAVGWLEPRRIVALTQGGRIFVADPETGGFRGTDRAAGPDCIDPWEKAVTRSRLVFLFGATLNAVDRDGNRRHVRLRGVPNDCSHVGLAVDQARELAYVVGVGSEVAVVQARALRVQYVPVGASRATRVASTRAALFGGFQVFAAHRNSRGMPKGVELVNTIRRTRRMIDPRAGAAEVAGERLLTYDGREPVSPGGSRGIRVFNLRGRLRYRFLKREVVLDLDVVGRFAYARTRGGLRVIDLRTRDVVSSSAFDAADQVYFVRPDRAGY